MAEYIDKALLLETTNQSPCENGNQRAAQLLHYILNAPTVDAVPVVRCHACRFWTRMPPRPDGETAEWGHCVQFWDVDSDTSAIMHENDFCSHGERKEPEGTR